MPKAIEIPEWVADLDEVNRPHALRILDKVRGLCDAEHSQCPSPSFLKHCLVQSSKTVVGPMEEKERAASD